MSNIEIDGLAEVVLSVRNLERSLAFYQGVLGLRRISPEDRPGPIFLQAGTAIGEIPAIVVLAPLPPDSPEFTGPRSLHHLALTTSAGTAAAIRPTLEELGYEVRDGKHPILRNVQTLYVTDPDGNEVELISPMPQS